jgi:hypothetical protein
MGTQDSGVLALEKIKNSYFQLIHLNNVDYWQFRVSSIRGIEIQKKYRKELNDNEIIQ